MLKITLHDSASELRFKLEGKLSGLWVGELRQCWQTASSTTKNRKTILDLAELDFVDHDGQQLLADMYRSGVRMMAMTPLIRSLVAEISRSCRCATVEEKPKQCADALLRSETAGSNQRAL